jgi:acetyltransferase
MIHARAIRATDEAAYLDILDRTTSDDRYYRFFRAVDHFDHADVARFVEPKPSVIGMIATDEVRGLGVAHAFLSGGTAEIALVVAADAQRRGVGRCLIGGILDQLAARGITTVTAVSLWENLGFAALARSFGMIATHAPTDGSVIHWALTLATRTSADLEAHDPTPKLPAVTPASKAFAA